MKITIKNAYFWLDTTYFSQSMHDLARADLFPPEQDDSSWQYVLLYNIAVYEGITYTGKVVLIPDGTVYTRQIVNGEELFIVQYKWRIAIFIDNKPVYSNTFMLSQTEDRNLHNALGIVINK